MSDDQTKKLIAMLASDNPGEVFNAAQMLKRRASAQGQTLAEFLSGGPGGLLASIQRTQTQDAAHKLQMAREKQRTKRFDRYAYFLGTFVSKRVREIAVHLAEQSMDLSDDEFMQRVGRPSWAKAKAPQKETA